LFGLEPAGGEEDADNRPDSGDPERDSEGAEHPLAMLRDLVAADGAIAEREEGKEEEREENCRSGFRCSSDRHGEAHDDCGEGGDFRAPMGIAIIGGVITSTLLTLLVIPTVYESLADTRDWIIARVRGEKRHHKKAHEPGPKPEARSPEPTRIANA